MKPINIIVAVDKSFGIGKDGYIPWHIPRDLKHFKEITISAKQGRKNAVIMGRKTWDSIPDKFKPLSDRINVVLTRNKDLVFPEGVIVAKDLNSAIESVEDVVDSIFIVGGGQCYKEALDCNFVDKLYITHIDNDYDCDTFFPMSKEDLKSSYERIFFTSVHGEDDTVFYFSEYKRV